MDVINKTMDRSDLFTAEGLRETATINGLIHSLYRQGVAHSSWVGTLPAAGPLERGEIVREPLERLGLNQRREYEPLPDAADDARTPWFLYWEIFWVLHVTRPFLSSSARLLDAGGASSLFSCYLGSLGFQVDTVDLNEKLIANNNLVSSRMGWNSRAQAMNLADLDFSDESFDHVYSICVFEHLDYPLKQAAIREIARCLRPGGFFALTFDYRNPAPGVLGVGKDPRPINQISSLADLERTFLTDPRFEVFGNRDFQDSGTSYLSHPMYDYAPYTFGALFLRKKW